MITSLTIKNFLGVASFDADITKTTLIAGPNASGKSSIANALRLAMCGELVRVPLKKRAGELVRVGAKSAYIGISRQNGEAIDVKITSSGAITGAPKGAEEAMLCSLDMHRFSGMNTDKRIELVSGMATWAGEAAIVDRMLKRGCDKALVEEVRPMLAGGSFKTALEYADEASEKARKAWRDITGEAYGESKAEGWESPKIVLEDASMVEAEIAGMDKELEKIASEIADLKAEESSTKAMTCPSCGTHLFVDGGSLHRHEDGRRYVDNSEKIAELTKQQRDIVADKNKLIGDLARIADCEKVAGKASDITAKAAAAHARNLAWNTVSDSLSPAGIQADLLDGTLRKINIALGKMSDDAGFKRTITLTSDMHLNIGGTIYQLASESEKWRASACMALCIGAFTHSGPVILDGLDVIEPESRLGIINMVKALDQQVVMMATLKSAPEIEGVASYWVG